MARPPDSPLSELTALDWIAVVVVCTAALFCFQFPFLTAPRFAKMFADFGDAKLPDITQLGMTIWFPMMVGLNPASVVFHAVSGRHTLARRRLLIVAAFGLSLAACGVLLYAMYAPVFAMAGSIQ